MNTHQFTPDPHTGLCAYVSEYAGTCGASEEAHGELPAKETNNETRKNNC